MNPLLDFYTPAEMISKNQLIQEINELKKQNNAVILAHNYQTPDVYHGVADFVGDSLQLAIEATKTQASMIVQAGVYFMAETSKILSPDKRVFIPSLKAGCSLSESITGADVKLLRTKYPDAAFVAYVNTSADVKAEVDVCVTSSNANMIVTKLSEKYKQIVFLPDKHLAANVERETGIPLIKYEGSCMVHETFDVESIKQAREAWQDVVVIAHPECPVDVVAASDFSGSTKAMIDYVKMHKPKRVVMVTECSMAANIASAVPTVEFVKPCNICPHMKRINLENIRDSLVYKQHEIFIPECVRIKAKKSITTMIEMSK
jgi:quinolinate synthase